MPRAAMINRQARRFNGGSLALVCNLFRTGFEREWGGRALSDCMHRSLFIGSGTPVPAVIRLDVPHLE